MGLTGISEFTFGFAFLYEQTRHHWAGLRAVPILPSLQAEADLGWDAHLPAAAVDFYYQFKLSDYLFAAHARFRKDGTYAGPYYRIGLHKRNGNQQHRRLYRHARRHPETYYVAPELSDVRLFQDAFLAQQIVRHSRLIPLNRCRDVGDSDQHYLTYVHGDAGFRQHSEATRQEGSRSGSELEAIYRESEGRQRVVDRSFAADLLESTRSAIIEEAEDDEDLDMFDRALLDRGVQGRDVAGTIERTAELVSVYYGATMVLVGAP